MKVVRSWESGKVKALGQQSLLVLCAAIYAIKQQGEKDPTRSRVLTYIKMGKLVAWEALDSDIWADEETMRMQYFSWCRENAAREGYLIYRGKIDHGIWRLSKKGEEYVERIADKWVKLGNDAEEIESKLHDIYHTVVFSNKFVTLLICIGKSRQASQVIG